MKLEDIGFYTLSDERARTADHTTRLHRCELLVTDRCNFACPYCRKTEAPDISWAEAKRTVTLWNARNVRFSGGEPTLWPYLSMLVAHAKQTGSERVALSTNGSAPREMYERLLYEGVDDFSVSLDACCASTALTMSGGRADLDEICKNIRWISARTYCTVGVVVDDRNLAEVSRTIELAAELGVADVRLIPSAQWDEPLSIDFRRPYNFPILQYRLLDRRRVRGITLGDSPTCRLALDDTAVSGGCHYPCIIYLREGGDPTGLVGEDIREERRAWVEGHNSLLDPICRKNCLDVCVEYNNRAKDTYQ